MTRPIPETPAAMLAIAHGDWLAWILPWGARLAQLWWLAAPEGPRPLTLGFARAQDYHQDTMALGATCGRYANRIGGARLERGGRRWDLVVNHSLGHSIHGGPCGFGVQDWQVEHQGQQDIVLLLDSADGDQGFPGNCRARVHHRIDATGLTWLAEVEMLSGSSPVNLVQHSYWNLDASGTLANHRLQVDASHYLPVGTDELPGEAAPVDGTPFDFRTDRDFPVEHVARIDAALRLDSPSGRPRRIARLTGGGLTMNISTDRPYLHLYAAAGLSPSAQALGATHNPGAGLCLETEDCPNGPARGEPVWYDAGQTYRHVLRLDFRQA